MRRCTTHRWCRMADASGMASGPSCFTIEFNDGSFLKEGQTVFVSYDGGGGLVDSNENSINSFSQIVNNSSTVYNDETAPTLMAAPMPSTQRRWSNHLAPTSAKSIDQSSVWNEFFKTSSSLLMEHFEQTGSFTHELVDAINDLPVDAFWHQWSWLMPPAWPMMRISGNYIGAHGRFRHGLTPPAIALPRPSRSGLTAQLSNQGQSVLLSYANTDTDYTDSGITDLAGNDLASFAFQLDNMSSQDFTNPELTDGLLDDNWLFHHRQCLPNSSALISIKTMLQLLRRFRHGLRCLWR